MPCKKAIRNRHLLQYINRNLLFRDMSTMVELTSFSTLGKIQPFLVTITTTAALLVDLHCHLTDKEVCGYLGGHWDINSHSEHLYEI